MRSKNNFKEYLKGFGIACCIWVFAIACFILPKYKFGYAKEGVQLNYEHVMRNDGSIGLGEIFGDVLELENGNVLFSGERTHNCYNKTWTDTILNFYNVPFEIYNLKTNTITDTFSLPSNLMYKPNALSLKNDKILLVNAYEAKNAKCVPELSPAWYKYLPFQYDSMILYNLKTKSVEQVIKKKMNKFYDNIEKYKSSGYKTAYNVLNDGRIMIFDPEYGLVEIFDLENNKSEVIKNKDLTGGGLGFIFPYGKNNALIFTSNYHLDFVYIYDDTKKEIRPFKKIENEGLSLIKYMGGNKFFVVNDNLIEVYSLEDETLMTYKEIDPLFELDYSINGEIFGEKFLFLLGGLERFSNFTGFYSPAIINLDNGKSYKGLSIPHYKNKPVILKLKNGDILIYEYDINIFKPWKWVR